MVLFPDARRAVEVADAAEPMWAEGYDVRRGPRRDPAPGRRGTARGGRRGPRDRRRRRALPPLSATSGRRRGGLIVHLHGGGFVFNDIDVHDAACRRFANRAGLPVLSVDYRLAPEHPFPAARDDVDAALAWLDRQDDLPGPTYVHGDSAGGNLALVAALRHPGRFRAVVLIYPFLEPGAGFDSYRTAADGFDAARPRGTGSSTPPHLPTSSTPTSPRCAPTGSPRCRRPWWSPRSTTRCATRASTSRPTWPTSGSRWWPPVTSVRSTASGGTGCSSRPRR